MGHQPPSSFSIFFTKSKNPLTLLYSSHTKRHEEHLLSGTMWHDPCPWGLIIARNLKCQGLTVIIFKTRLKFRNFLSVEQMTSSQSEKTPFTWLVLFMVGLSLGGTIVAGAHYYAVDLPAQEEELAPENDVQFPQINKAMDRDLPKIFIF